MELSLCLLKIPGLFQERHRSFVLLLPRAKSHAHARSRARSQSAPQHAQRLYEHAAQQPRFHGWLQSHCPLFPRHASTEPNEHDPGATYGKLRTSAKHEHAAESRYHFLLLFLLLLLYYSVCSCASRVSGSFAFSHSFCCTKGPSMMHQQPPSQPYSMPPGGAGQHYQGQQNPMGMMGQVNQGNHVMGQRPMPPYRPPQQGKAVSVCGVKAVNGASNKPHFFLLLFSTSSISTTLDQSPEV